MKVAEKAAREVAGWCIVDAVEPDGSMRRVAVLHPNLSLSVLASELEDKYPPVEGDSFGAARILKTQQPELVSESGESGAIISTDRRKAGILEALGFNSFIVVPLKARGRLMGALTFLALHPDDRFTPKDLLFAEDLACRMAMVMDNARLLAEAEAAWHEAEAATERAVLADRAKTDFLATMSHELRTPLNAIAGYAELLEMGMRGPISEQQRDAISRIRKSEQHLLGVVNDILMLSRSENGRIPLNLETTGVGAAVDEVHFLVEPMFSANDMQFSCEGTDNVYVVADHDRLNHILVNLISNAAKFSEKGESVRVKCEVRGHLVEIHVDDSGPGIEADKLEEIFKPFVQLSRGLTRTAEGSGLGLAISRELARLMGGDVTVKSKPGVGSRFTLTLPMSTPRLPVMQGEGGE